MSKRKPKVIIIRVELDADFYDLARSLGYSLKDIREAIAQAGMAELSELVSRRQE